MGKMIHYWVLGGQFTSLNFHNFTKETAIIEGPFTGRSDAEAKWKELSELHKYKADYRFIITEEVSND